MSAVPLVLEIICTFCLAAFLIHRYGDVRKQRILSTLPTFVAWYFSFLIVFVLPLDVSSTFYRQCLRDNTVTTSPTTTITTTTSRTTDTTNASILSSSVSGTHSNNNVNKTVGDVGVSGSPCEVPLSHVPDNILPALWRVVYWSSQLLTWLILPLMQSYSSAGDFSIAGKIKTALIENAIYYGTYLLIFGICLIYVAARPDLNIDGDKLKIICVTASNTWGLFLLVLLLGYGLVEVPRTAWNSGKKGYMLSRTQFKISKLSTEKTESEENLEDVLDEIKQISEKIKYNHPLRKHVDTILLKCPESMRHSVSRNKDDYEDYDTSRDTPTEKTLVKLHKRVIEKSQAHKRTHAQWNMLMERAFELEDIEANEGNRDRTFKHSFTPTNRGLLSTIYTPQAEWYWKCLLKPWVMRILAVMLTIFSFMVVWSECLFFVKSPVLSLFAVFLNLAKMNYDYVYIEFASILTIAYLCFCAYYSVFQIRILNWYYIAPHHQTDEYSLAFTGILLCRLTPPMCLNFLGLIHLDSHITYQGNIEETSYTEIMGHMDVISIISDGFNIYFPILIVLLCICTYFSLGSRFLQFLGFQQFIGDDDDMTQELSDEGREMIRRERRKLERKAESEARRRDWNERFGDDSTSGISSSARTNEIETATDLKLNRVQKKYTVPRSPDEKDTTELLRQAEPIDYMGETSDPLNDFIHSSESSGYQSSQGASTQSSRYGMSRPHSRPPPKGIFDDV